MLSLYYHAVAGVYTFEQLKLPALSIGVYPYEG
jgi:hypothetical protein